MRRVISFVLNTFHRVSRKKGKEDNIFLISNSSMKLSLEKKTARIINILISHSRYGNQFYANNSLLKINLVDK